MPRMEEERTKVSSSAYVDLRRSTNLPAFDSPSLFHPGRNLLALLLVLVSDDLAIEAPGVLHTGGLVRSGTFLAGLVP